jgi:putative intracellular protease/amidase
MPAKRSTRRRSCFAAYDGHDVDKTVAACAKGHNFAMTAVVDGRLITGQNPNSARATAALLIAALRSH